MTLAQYALYSLMGICVVFAALALLMLIIKIIASIPQKGARATDAQDASAVDAAPEPEAVHELAPGSAGTLKLYDTDPRDAAMVMAIVADELGKPLNELRFLSIKEVKR